MCVAELIFCTEEIGKMLLSHKTQQQKLSNGRKTLTDISQNKTYPWQIKRGR